MWFFKGDSSFSSVCLADNVDYLEDDEYVEEENYYNVDSDDYDIDAS